MTITWFKFAIPAVNPNASTAISITLPIQVTKYSVALSRYGGNTGWANVHMSYTTANKINVHNNDVLTTSAAYNGFCIMIGNV